MDENLIKAFLAIAGAIIGAIIAALTNAYAANQKIKEIEIGYRFKLRDGYLENARKMSEQVYLPINILLTNLSMAYDKLRLRINFDDNTVPVGSQNAFLAASREYLREIDQLLSRGADAYLTTDLDQRLQYLNSFLRESATAEKTIKKIIFETGSDSTFLPIPATKFVHQTTSKTLSRFGVSKMSLTVPGLPIRFGYAEETLAAPFQSREFEQRFQKDVSALKSLIKEVVLGTRAIS
ncbi:MAG: hypothetical protein H7312_12920 [Tardiphaga sp.]|nr:hypothetical protein [Tardiphaga sp.]